MNMFSKCESKGTIENDLGCLWAELTVSFQEISKRSDLDRRVDDAIEAVLNRVSEEPWDTVGVGVREELGSLVKKKKAMHEARMEYAGKIMDVKRELQKIEDIIHWIPPSL